MLALLLALLLAGAKGKAAIAVGSEVPPTGVKDVNMSDANGAATWILEVSSLVSDVDMNHTNDPSNGSEPASGNSTVNDSDATDASATHGMNSGAPGSYSRVDLETIGASKPLLEDRIEKLPGTPLPIVGEKADLVLNTGDAGAYSKEGRLEQSEPSWGSQMHGENDTNKHSGTFCIGGQAEPQPCPPGINATGGTDKMYLVMEVPGSEEHAENAGDTNDTQLTTGAMHSTITTTVRSISGLEDTQQPTSSASHQKKLRSTGSFHFAWSQLSPMLLGGTVVALACSCLCIVLKVSATGVDSHFQRIADSRTPKRYGRRGEQSPGHHQFYMV